MNRFERFNNTVNGVETDRPPVGCWIHYGSALWTPADSAAAHLRFTEEYDWDFIKVMNDYRLATPGGISEIFDAAQFAGFGGTGIDYPGFATQLETLRLIKEAAPDRPVVDTLFSPLQTVIRALGETVVPFFKESPELAHTVLDAVTSRLEEYVTQVRDGGTDGMYLSINGASKDAAGWGITSAEFTDWVAPYDTRVLRAAEGMTRIIHVHGNDLDSPLVEDYPAEVMSWSHHHTAPTVESVVAAGKMVPMVGLDESSSIYWPPSMVEANVMQARRAAGDKLIVAPGCTVHSDTPPAVLSALRQSVELPLDAKIEALA